jgi:hypothetical protein
MVSSDNEEEEDQEYLERARAKDTDDARRVCLLSLYIPFQLFNVFPHLFKPVYVVRHHLQ